MVTYAGGYARRVEDTVTIHCNTVQAAKEIFLMRIAACPPRHIAARLCRNATLVDPMLSDAGPMAAIQNSPRPRPNPLVPLPWPAERALDGVSLCWLRTRTATTGTMPAIQLVPKDLPLLCQPEDLKKMEAVHFVNASAVHDMKYWSHICITRTPAQHGTGEIGRAMAPSSGYVLSNAGEPTLYSRAIPSGMTRWRRRSGSSSRKRLW